MGRAKVIQIRQNDFLQDQNFQNLQNFLSVYCLSKLLHHTHLVSFIIDVARIFDWGGQTTNHMQ